MSVSHLEMLIWGKHPVDEAIRSANATVHELFLTDDRDMPKLPGASPPSVRQLSRDALAKKVGTDKHQNVGARVSLNTWGSFSEWLDAQPQRETTTVIAIDGIQDPQNVGSLLRSAHFFGADACLMTRDRVAPLTGAVAKASAGAIFSLPIIRAVNLARELETAGESGFWRVGLEAEAKANLGELKIGTQNVLLVVGAEGEGLRDLTRKRCDQLAKLPGSGRRDSLNAAVAGAIALYEIFVQRAR